MLIQLIKHEFKTTFKFPLLLNLFVLIASVIGGYLITLQMYNMYFPIILYWVFTLLCMIIIWSAVIGTQVHLALHFYRSCFSNEGYLTFTLPTTPAKIFTSKLIIAILWTIFNTLITLVCLTLTLFIPMFQGVTWSEIPVALTYLGFSPSVGIALIFAYLVGIISNLLLIYFSLCMGQTARKHRILTSVLCYGLTFIFIQIIQSVCTYTNSTYFTMNNSSMAVMSNLFSSSTIISTATALVLYILSISILNKKLNLK